MGTILLIVLVLLLLGAVPSWHSRQWGYGPSGILGLVLVIILLMVVFNVIPWGWSSSTVP